MSDEEVVDGEATEVADDAGPEGATASEAALPAVIAEAEQTQAVERQAAQPPTTVLPSPKEWEAAMTMASTIANTEFVGKGMRGKPDAVLACILAGREIGIGPMQALREISILDGKAVFGAALMMSQLRKGGIRILGSSSTAERAWIHAKRSDTGEEAEVEWTMVEAQAVVSSNGKRLVDKDNWANYPADMLWARCVGRLARRLGSDLLGGMNYTAEEVADFDDYEGSYSTGAPAAPTKSPLGKPVVDRRADGPDSIPKIMEMLTAAEPTVAWAETIAVIVHGWYSDDHYDSVKALPADERGYFLVRLANMAAILSESSTARGDFPPATLEEFQQAVAKSFDGLVVEWVVRTEDESGVLVPPEPTPEPQGTTEQPEPEAKRHTEPSGKPDPVAEAREFVAGLPDVPGGA